MKKPVALLITDTHLHKNNIDLVKDIFDQAVKVCKEKKIKNIFHLGDFFTSREAQPLQVLDDAQMIIENIIDNKIEFSIIAGNHDKTMLEANNSYVSVSFKNFNIRIIDDVINSFWLVDNELFKNLNIIWIPYFKEKGSYLEKLKEATSFINKNKKNILLTHIAVNGVNNNDGSKVENEISLDLFKKFDSVFIGHYHDKQDSKNIYYIGSAYQSNFGEDNIKGFTILYDDGSHEFVKSKFPEFIKMKVDVKDIGTLKKIKKEEKDHVRVILTGDVTELKSFNKEDLLAQGIDVKLENEEVNTNFDISNDELMQFNRSNIKDAFDKFCEINNVDEEEKVDYGYKYLELVK